MNTRQTIFNHLATTKGIFLPDQILNDVLKTVRKNDFFGWLYDLEDNSELNQYDTPENGAYEFTPVIDFSQKSISKLDKKSGAMIQKYDSVVAAAKSVGGKEKAGNISNATKTGGTAYGFKWKANL